ncbi:hypothetical protein HMF8227_01866 [Saliniradius amylolyticus]|uniref:Fe(3+) dicitrate transport protein FecA n=1 Tax=Saliniradius amylolyticus TaxID=2183582 RepID=A0A2S2E3V4_9ALTE|nr:TonB-dependent receptor [Saliniradius amylolyticus]AWL12336.1 hypothetical protein HMF8227_01866 [Saliniradius amylolyticus]
MKKTLLMRPLSLSVLAALTLPALAEGDETSNIERVSVIGTEQQLSATAGSVTRLDEQALAKFEYDDIGRILAQVPGVNIRSEDGYGLRPNIGFRGVTPERSKKINIMEDGVLIGPAPYSAPAAYYFPMTSRMTAVEVTKGPGTIQYGPNTVAGTLNLVTRPVPLSGEGMVDLSLGGDGYAKAHAYYGDTQGDFGYLLEGLRVQTDGFKELDGGGDTGFEKNDLMFKANWDLSSQSVDQLLEVKASYADEVSDETYLGLTDGDFAVNPLRRYAATQLAEMDWQHSQLQLTHHLSWQSLDVTTRAYRHDFERSWEKLNRFTSSQGGNVPSLLSVLTDPEQYWDYYQVLTGERDASIQQILVLGDNAREYYSQGVQMDGAMPVTLAGVTHNLEAGVRFHQDEIQRNHTEQNFLMTDGQMVATGESVRATTTNLETTRAWSVYIQDRIELGDWAFTLGTRGEDIDGYYRNRNRKPNAGDDWQRKEHRIWLPSASALYRVDEQQSVFAGVHKGFVPTSPLQDKRIEPEKSLNYELGWRYRNGASQAEVVGFFNDVDNLKESCSFSTAASCASDGDLDQDFNAGAVEVYGLEASINSYMRVTGELTLPWSVVYTHTQSEFKQGLDSDFDLWGEVDPGDEVPYLPDNVLTLTVGVAASDWRVTLLVNHTGEMREAAGQGVVLSGKVVPSHTLVDLSASYDVSANGQLYLKLDNLLDEVEIGSRRPYGARPTKPQQAFVGYKYHF